MRFSERSRTLRAIRGLKVLDGSIVRALRGRSRSDKFLIPENMSALRMLIWFCPNMRKRRFSRSYEARHAVRHMGVLTVCAILLHPPYLEPSWWKVGDVVAVKIEEHQLLGSRECLRMDGLYGITRQVDALHLWNCSQNFGFQVCDTILTFTQQDNISYQPVLYVKSHLCVWEIIRICNIPT